MTRKPEPVGCDELKDAILAMMVERFGATRGPAGGRRPLTWEAATMGLALAAFEIKQLALFAPRGTVA